MRDTKGIVHAKVGITKDRNGTDLTEAEDMQENTEVYKKIFTTQITTMV